MRFYKAIKGTDVYEKYGDDLIYDEAVAFNMTTTYMTIQWEHLEV